MYIYNHVCVFKNLFQRTVLRHIIRLLLRVLNEQFYARRVQKLIYRQLFKLFHEDLSSILGTNIPNIEEKSS